MTDTQTMSPAEAGEQLLDTLRRHYRRQDVDVEAAVERFLQAAAGTATEDALAGVTSAVKRAEATYQRALQHQGGLPAERLGDMQIPRVAAAVDQVTHQFARLAELLAAELEVIEREQAARDALAELEAAVNAGDVDKVMSLRGQVEVGHPRRIAEARKELLRLQIEQAEALLTPAAERVRQAVDTEAEAKRRHAAAVAELAAATEGVGRAGLIRESVQGVSAEQAERIRRLQAELSSLETNHDREMQTRLRRIAGLPEPTSPDGVEPEVPRQNLIRQSISPHAPGNRANHSPVLNLSPSETTTSAPLILTD